MATIHAQVKGDSLVLTLPLRPKPFAPSSTGKTLTVATTNGNVPTDVVIDGMVLTVGVNAYVKPLVQTQG